MIAVVVMNVCIENKVRESKIFQKHGRNSTQQQARQRFAAQASPASAVVSSLTSQVVLLVFVLHV